jgi:radical SAM-linked protein
LKAQRLRFRYRLTEGVGAFSNRDLVLLWEEALGRAGYVVSRSEGKRPSPQIALAAPLPLGVTSECELVDVFLNEPARADDVLSALQANPPAPTIETVSVREIGVDAASLQSQLCWAEYEVTVAAGRQQVESAVERLLAADTVPVEFQRQAGTKRYDLRPLVLDLTVADAAEGRTRITMRLRAAPDRTARADQVVAALGLSPAERISRIRLEVEEVPGILLSYRRRGALEDEAAS